jgi:hypothetical protein
MNECPQFGHEKRHPVSDFGPLKGWQQDGLGQDIFMTGLTPHPTTLKRVLTISKTTHGPPVSIPGQPATGNARQFLDLWVDALSGGYQQDFPFQIRGALVAVPEPGSLLALLICGLRATR